MPLPRLPMTVPLKTCDAFLLAFENPLMNIDLVADFELLQLFFEVGSFDLLEKLLAFHHGTRSL